MLGCSHSDLVGCRLAVKLCLRHPTIAGLPFIHVFCITQQKPTLTCMLLRTYAHTYKPRTATSKLWTNAAFQSKNKLITSFRCMYGATITTNRSCFNRGHSRQRKTVRDLARAKHLTLAKGTRADDADRCWFGTLWTCPEDDMLLQTWYTHVEHLGRRLLQQALSTRSQSGKFRESQRALVTIEAIVLCCICVSNSSSCKYKKVTPLWKHFRLDRVQRNSSRSQAIILC